MPTTPANREAVAMERATQSIMIVESQTPAISIGYGKTFYLQCKAVSRLFNPESDQHFSKSSDHLRWLFL